MRIAKFIASLGILALAFIAVPVSADEPEAQPVKSEYFRGEVTSSESELDGAGVQIIQQLEIQALTGSREGQTVSLEHFFPKEQEDARSFQQGDVLVVMETEDFQGNPQYFAIDHYRLPVLAIVFAIFLLVAVVFAQKKGALSILGLLFSVLILVGLVVPQLAAGRNPLIIGVLAILAIGFVSFFVAHGFNRRTAIALTGTFLTLGLVAVAAWFFVDFANLFGVGSEEAYDLQMTFGQKIDFRALFHMGMLIGALGVLDDITAGIVASVGEIHNADKTLSSAELYKRGLVIGREHIASLINTLVLAYAGAAMPLLLLFTLDFQPIWVSLNTQFLAEEVVRTLVGSLALVLAVPITTKLAALWIPKLQASKPK